MMQLFCDENEATNANDSDVQLVPVVVPIVIEYDLLPDDDRLAGELMGKHRAAPTPSAIAFFTKALLPALFKAPASRAISR